jgi:hypothetical protein
MYVQLESPPSLTDFEKNGGRTYKKNVRPNSVCPTPFLRHPKVIEMTDNIVLNLVYFL